METKLQKQEQGARSGEANRRLHDDDNSSESGRQKMENVQISIKIEGMFLRARAHAITLDDSDDDEFRVETKRKKKCATKSETRRKILYIIPF